MIWYIIFALVLVAAAILGIIAHRRTYRNPYRDTTNIQMTVFILILTTLIGFVCITAIHMEYAAFIETYNEQKVLYDTLAITNPEQSNSLWIIDMMAVNQDLASLKGRKRAFGMWSILPESVFELEPIGMPVG